MKSFRLLLLVILGILVHVISAAPAPTKSTPAPEEIPNETVDQSTGLYYDEYLQEVVKLLESDENFRKTMENADFEDIKTGKLSSELHKIPAHIREKLDVLKQNEISRLRKILRVKMDVEKGRKPAQFGYLRSIAQHLDSSNVHTFEAEDLTKLIKAATTDLENYDEKRHEDFKRYEMMKDMDRLEKLNGMNEADRKKAEEEYREKRKRHDNHPKVNHPGSRAQLDEVWKEQDGLTDEKFDPKTFFIMHDIHGDGMLDTFELEALFEKELAKVYDVRNPDDDMVEMEEERMRMREHFINEVDKNKDGLISMDEFLNYTRTNEFENPDENSFKNLDDLIEENEVYTHEELEEFRQMIKEHEEELKSKLQSIKHKSDSIDNLKKEVASHEEKIGPDPPVHEKVILQGKKEQIKLEENELKEMKEEAKEHREDLADMKEELIDQEKAFKEQKLIVDIDKVDDMNKAEIQNNLSPIDSNKDEALDMEKKPSHD